MSKPININNSSHHQSHSPTQNEAPIDYEMAPVFQENPNWRRSLIDPLNRYLSIHLCTTSKPVPKQIYHSIPAQTEEQNTIAISYKKSVQF